MKNYCIVLMAPVRSKSRRRGKSTGQNGLAERRGGRERGVGMKESGFARGAKTELKIFKLERSEKITITRLPEHLDHNFL